jgi:hypothetical protein
MKQALAVAAVLLLAPSLARADVSLGANFGATLAFQEGVSGGRFAFGGPYSHASALAPTPGLRFGFTGGTGHHEGYLDTAVAFYPRFDEHSVLLTGNYQYNFDGKANTFFITGGGGPLFHKYNRYSATAFIFGGGVGLRQRVADGHGTIREEIRFDFIPGSSSFPQTFMLGFKFGFDLWFR